MSQIPSVPVAAPVGLLPDPRRVCRALGRAVGEGSPGAAFLAAMARLLMERLADLRLSPQRVLELGCRSPALTGALRERWPGVAVVRLAWGEPAARALVQAGRLEPGREGPVVVGGLERLPFAAATFDLVVSNMALHWARQPVVALAEVARVLRPEAPLFFTLAGEATLGELARAVAAVDRARHGRPLSRGLSLPSLSAVGEMMVAAGLARPVVDRELLSPEFASLASLRRGLRSLGGGRLLFPPSAPLFERELPQLLAAALDQGRGTSTGGNGGGMRITVEVVAGHAWRGDG
ncbi:MAG: methyltransferase domain-containing protein [Magnetococcales bacterium]|nr:methyltransferase domain-containing protein [Magnetococcales bacterium]